MPVGWLTAKIFRDLLVRRKAFQVVLALEEFRAVFPRQDTYGLWVQMKRAAISIAANIAEGFRNRGKAGNARFLNTPEG